MSVAWPGRRGDVEAALETLAAEPPALARRQRDPRFPGVDDAVHWLVDDTFWDHHDPSGHIGLILRNVQEAAAIRAVVDPLVALCNHLGNADDRKYFRDPAWNTVREAAATALRLMRTEPS